MSARARRRNRRVLDRRELQVRQPRPRQAPRHSGQAQLLRQAPLHRLTRLRLQHKERRSLVRRHQEDQEDRLHQRLLLQDHRRRLPHRQRQAHRQLRSRLDRLRRRVLLKRRPQFRVQMSLRLRHLHRWLWVEVQLPLRRHGLKLRLANRRCIPLPGIMFIFIRRAASTSTPSCPLIAFFMKRAASVMRLQLRLYT